VTDQLPSGFGHLSSYVAPPEDRPPTAEELTRPIVAPGREALLPYGIEYQAPLDLPSDGLARHARAQVLALSRAGLPVALRRMTRPKMMLDDDEEYLKAPHLTDSQRQEILARIATTREVSYLRDISLGSVLVAIRQMVIGDPVGLENIIAPAGARLAGFEKEMAVYKSTIVYTPWERDTVSPAIVAVLNRCAEVWVQGEWCVDVFHRAGVRNVHCVPVPYDPATSPVCRIPSPRGSEHVPDGKRFYAIGKWEPRKNYDALLGAFLLEFTPKERASLFLKTSNYGTRWEGYPSPPESVEKWLADPTVLANGWTPGNFSKRVRIVSKLMAESDITKLHRENNIYVSCSHGEGHDMPAFDARCAGNRMVYTGWSGPAEFVGPGDVSVWPSDGANRPPMEPVHPGYGWESDARWAMAPVEQIRTALRLAKPPVYRVHPPELYRRFSSVEVGSLMRHLIAKRFPDAHEKLQSVGSFG